MKYLIDANIFLEAQLEQGKSQVCRELLTEIQDGKIDAGLTMFHADTIGVIMEDKGLKDKISGFMLSLYMYEGLDVFTLGLSTKADAMLSYDDLSFDDGVAAKAVDEIEADAIISYDKDFDGVVERKTPEEILENTT